MQSLLIPLSLVLGLISYGLIAKWYVVPALAPLPKHSALIPLVLFHCFRYIGLGFLVPGVVSFQLSPQFALPTAYGDLIAALLALLAVAALKAGWGAALTLVWIFNVVGLLDLVVALFQGLGNVEPGQLGAAYFIPALAVPALLVCHFLIFQLLLRREN